MRGECCSLCGADIVTSDEACPNCEGAIDCDCGGRYVEGRGGVRKCNRCGEAPGHAQTLADVGMSEVDFL